ncbi:hypothetical protein SLH47_06965 [Cognatiyoonia sp. IB215182]|nr:hypothetical protein [Cognatiyoonia sp. IB215182]
MERFQASILRVFAFAFFCVVIAVSPAKAEPIPGADDPALREAALMWLAEDQPESALRTIGELAADGNVAARLFLNQVFVRRTFHNEGLTREAFLALLPAVSSEDERRLRPFNVDHESYPALRALRRIAQAETSEEWIDNAEVIIAAGMKSRLAPFVELGIVNNDTIDIELAKFAAENLQDDPDVSRIVTWFFGYSHVTADLVAEMNPAKAEENTSRWKGEFWTTERAEAFQQALISRNWMALEVRGMLRWFDEGKRGLAMQSEIGEHTLRLAELISIGPYGPDYAPQPPTTEEIDTLATNYRRYAEGYPWATPNVRLCEEHCQSQAATCVAMLGLLGDAGLGTQPNYTPVLTVGEYYQSDRAAAERLIALGLVDLPPPRYPEWLELPRCLMEPARRAAGTR